MTTPSTLQPESAHPILARDPVRVERYDTRLRDFGALTPLATGSAEGARGIAQGNTGAVSFWRESLTLMEQYLSFGRRKVRAGDQVYCCGEAFDMLFLVSSGLFKIVNLAPDGREQPAGLYFKGDWLGFDGIPKGRHGCTAVALDAGEVWTIHYDALLQASAKEPMLMRVMLAAMSAQLARNRDAMLAMGTLPADARVADFLLQWANALAERGLRTDQIHVHMTRADMGDYLGLTLESVSRALSRLARSGVIEFNERGRRDIGIPSLAALSEFIQNIADPSGQTLQ
jgi:CRP/FNR family transcriptional regulator, anaerobic regulatory protein